MDERSSILIQQVAEKGDINGLYELIGMDRRVLERIDEIPFENTPLHLAAAAGHTRFAIEIMRLKPSFGRKLNPEGLSPLHLALRNGHFHTVRRLVEIDSELIRVQGKEGFTALHFVVEAAAKADPANEEADHIAHFAHIDLLAEFLLACPASIEDQTIEAETAVHIAVKNRSVRTLKVLLGWLQRTENKQVLARKDDEGNTVLHLAAFTNQTQVMGLLVKEVNKDSRNFAGLRAIDIVTGLPSGENREEAKRILSRGKAAWLPRSSDLANFLSSNESFIEKKIRAHVNVGMGEAKNTLLVVAVLIVTATYQAALSPPGGLSQEPLIQINGTGSAKPEPTPTLVALPRGYFNVILALNTMALSLSATLMVALVPIFLQNTTYFIVFTLVLTYMVSIIAISGTNLFAKFWVTVYVLYYASYVFFLRGASGGLTYRCRMQYLVVDSKYKLQNWMATVYNPSSM